VLLVLGERFENELTNGAVGCSGDCWAQQRETSALTVDAVLARWKRHIAARAGAAFPDREADQLQSGEDAILEVQFGLRELSRGVAAVTRDEPRNFGSKIGSKWRL